MRRGPILRWWCKMQTSLPRRKNVGTSELPGIVDRLLDERHPLKLTDLEKLSEQLDPIEKIKAMIRKPKGESK